MSVAATNRGASFGRVERTGCGKPPRDCCGGDAAIQRTGSGGRRAERTDEARRLHAGGFYNHFESKADLVAEVLASAIAEGNGEFAKMARAPVDESTTALRRYINWYLSQAHRDNIDHGCPVTGFAGDAPRLGAAAQSHFAGGLGDQITILAGLLAENGSLAAAGEHRTLRERAISLHCEMVGALVLSRSVAQAAPALSNEILENVQRAVTASLSLLSSRTSNKGKT